MKVIGFDGKEHNWQIYKFHKEKVKASKPHQAVRKLLKELFPCHTIIEEATLPGSQTKFRKSKLYCDFFIVELRMMIEVHGRQHYEHVPFFHSDKMSFVKAKKRDRDKQEWCAINNFYYVELPEKDTEDNWKERILNAEC